MNRREFLSSAAAVSAGALLLPRGGWAAAAFDPQPGPWRSFAVTTRVAIAAPEGGVQVWLPMPSTGISSVAAR